ncbi:hypothetical protein LCGC14_2361090 [marine sediment metagenome]|uniref:Uncharacterized protein n=1 Tax=marine sediment metagenome TaxID=412755 RepID=A0A0F9CTX5_9ZZZZ
MGAIDIGLEAIDRSAVFNIAQYTVVGKDNPANDTGTITDVDIWLSVGATNDVWFGTFSEGAANVLTCRDSESVGNVAAGSKQSFSGLDIDVVTGDYLGTYAKTSSAGIERAASGFADVWTYLGEKIDPADSATFAVNADDGVSLFGTGSSVWAGGDVGGVAIAGIAKINGVALADITKVNGVA